MLQTFQLNIFYRGSELLTDLDLKEKEMQIAIETRMLESIKSRIDKIKDIKMSVDFKELKTHDSGIILEVQNMICGWVF
jgi:hypothetical protein